VSAVGKPVEVLPGRAYQELLLPEHAVWVDACRWRRHEVPDRASGGVVWGEAKLAGGTGPAAIGRRVLARELAIASLRLGAGGPRSVRVHRLAASGGAEGSRRQRLGRRMRRGTLVELLPPDGRTGERPLDEVATQLGLRPTAPPIVGAGGCVIQRAIAADGRASILRVGLAGDPSDPTTAAEALARLAHLPQIGSPLLLGRGRTGATTWSLETVVRGRSGAELTSEAWSHLVGAWAGLPRSAGPPTAPSHDLHRIGGYLPRHAIRSTTLARAVEARLGCVPGVLAHRDLWTANVLRRGSRYSGVIDWGSWRADGVPGSDLLQLYASTQRPRRGGSLGRAWARRPWRDPGFVRSTDRYWEAVDVHPSDHYLDAVAVAWWAAEVAGTLERIPQRRHDLAWLVTNVDPVLEATAAW
jgi:hypothetical protein